MIVPVRLTNLAQITETTETEVKPSESTDATEQQEKTETMPLPSYQVAETESVNAQNTSAQQKTAASQSAVTKSGVGQGGVTSGLDNDLWAAIEPCWRRVANLDTLPVTLTVSFGPDGKLSAVPIIERLEGTGIGPQFQRSEAQAIQALAECGGYSMAASQTNVRIVFPRL